MFFDFAFHAGKQIYSIICVRTYPPVVEFFDREWVDVVPSKTPFTLRDNEIRLLENAQMLHYGAPVQLLEVFA